MTTPIIPTSRKFNRILLLLFFLYPLLLYAQEKETIYIKYDKERVINDSLEQIGFTLYPKIHSSFFFGKLIQFIQNNKFYVAEKTSKNKLNI